MKKKIRVVQFGVGPIGASIVRLLRQKSSVEIAGAIDRDPGKAGRDLGEVVGAPDAPWGIALSARAPAVLDKQVDVVIHTTSSHLPHVMDELLACLAAGCCVVSTCEELAYPFRKYPELSAQLDAAAKEEGVALVGTGVNPGFVMDKLVLVLSAATQRVDSVRAVRIVDASKRRLPLQKKIGAGMTPEEFREQVAAGIIKHHGLPESVAMVADSLGFGGRRHFRDHRAGDRRGEDQDAVPRGRAGARRRRASDRARHRRRRREDFHGAADVRRREESRRHGRVARRAQSRRSPSPEARTETSPPPPSPSTPFRPSSLPPPACARCAISRWRCSRPARSPEGRESRK